MRLLTGVREDRPLTLAEHRAVHGPLPRERDLLAEVRAAGLTGRGGAAFPVARKLEATLRGRGRPVVVVNAAESEPGSLKDETLLCGNPHVVLDGAAEVATSLGARTVYVWLHRGAERTMAVLSQALAERRTRPVRVRVVAGPDRYVAGDASAAVRRISGGPSLPAVSPYRTAERGVHGRPTFVANVETYGHLALLARHGASWFREAGTDDEPGTLLVTVREPSAAPRVVEVATGTPVVDVLTATSPPPAGALVGGYGGAWLGGDTCAVARLSRASLAALGADLGVGLVLTLPRGHCPLAETERLLWWLASESTGQCGPCVNGLPRLARAFRCVVERGSAADVSAVEALGGLVLGRGACSAPDGAVRLAASALREFPDHVLAHETRGPCSGSAVAALAPLPPPPQVGRGESWR